MFRNPAILSVFIVIIFVAQSLFMLNLAKNSDKILIPAVLIALNSLILLILIRLVCKNVLKYYLNQKEAMKLFFNDAMHDLKTPLGIASINLEMLELRNKHTYRIKSALKQMKIAYEDIEYFMKNSQMKLGESKIHLSSFLHQRVRFLNAIAGVKNIIIKENIEPNLYVFMSEIELMRIIDNTISNAIKYSKEGSEILINLRLFNDSFALFSVKDFGIGIKDTKAIWRRYIREDSSRGGFGLGLSIIRDICKKYDIKYQVSSVYQQGSIFSYQFSLYKEKFLDKTNN